MPKGKKAKSVTKAKPEASLPAKTAIPEELEAVWDEETSSDWETLNINQRGFITAFLGPARGNASEAYRIGYNRPLLNTDTTHGLAASVLRSPTLCRILEKFLSNKTEVMFTVVNGYREMAQASKPNWVKDDEGQYENAGDLPDWQARNWAFTGLRGVYGLDKTKDDGPATQTNIIVQVQLPSRPDNG